MLSESFPVEPREEREPPGRGEKGRGCAMNITVWVQLWEPRGRRLPWRSGRDLGRLHRGVAWKLALRRCIGVCWLEYSCPCRRARVCEGSERKVCLALGGGVTWEVGE